MKNFITKALAFGPWLFLSAAANAAYINLDSLVWGIDSNGLSDGIVDVQYMDELNYEGYAIVEIDDIDNSSGISAGDTFTDSGWLYVTDALDTNNVIEATFDSWTGKFTSSNNYSFDRDGSNTMTWTSTDLADVSTDILTAKVVYGEGSLEAPSAIDFFLDISWVAPSYFYVFDEFLNDWVDLVNFIAEDDLIFSFVNTGNQVINPDDEFNQFSDPSLEEVVAELSAVTGYTAQELGNLISDPTSGAFVTYSDGNLDIGTVPEPGMLSLMGLACLGFAGFQLRRRNAKDA